MVTLVLNSPVFAGMGVKIGSANLIAWAAGDDEGEFLAETGADKIENIAADAGNLANVGEINPRRIGDPARPPIDPSMATFLDDITGGSRKQRLALPNHFSLKSRLIPLDGHQEVKLALPLDIFSCFTLRVSCIKGDQDVLTIGYRNAVEKILNLSDLIGSVRYSDLGNRDRFIMKHRGEQRHLGVIISPCPPQYLSVECDHQKAFAVPVGPFEQPRTDRRSNTSASISISTRRITDLLGHEYLNLNQFHFPPSLASRGCGRSET
jgi:hypothetical protein